MYNFDELPITDFTGKFRWLSNFHCAPVVYEGTIYSSTEHAYQAAKCEILKDRVPFLTMTCAAAQKYGQLIPLRPHWEGMKYKVMYDVVLDKFTRHTDLKAKLLATNDRKLVEANKHCDNFYGICTCIKCKEVVGQNNLGKILMQVRDELRKSDAIDASIAVEKAKIATTPNRHEASKYEDRDLWQADLIRLQDELYCINPKYTCWWLATALEVSISTIAHWSDGCTAPLLSMRIEVIRRLEQELHALKTLESDRLA